MNTKVTQTVADQIKSLVSANFPKHLGTDNTLRLFPDLNEPYCWDEDANIERLCFNVGPARTINPDNISYEVVLNNSIKERLGRIDVLMHSSMVLTSFGGKCIFCLDENKLAFDEKELSSKLITATGQLKDYVNIIQEYSHPIYKFDSVVFLSISIFNPLVFLNSPNNYINYLNDKNRTPNEKFVKYGIYVATIKLDLLQDTVDILLMQNTRDHVIPGIMEIKGNLYKDYLVDPHNFTMSVKLDALRQLPLTNVNPTSKINNPRELMPESIKVKKRRITILNTMDDLNTKLGRNSAEKSRTLGAKNRETAYHINHTITLREFSKNESKFEDLLLVATTDMALIDGQNSTLAMLNIYDDTYNELRLVKTSAANFKAQMFDYVFGVNFKGYDNEELALTAAINQNNITKQSRIDEVMVAFRDEIIRLANEYNGNSSYIFNFNKSAYSPLIELNIIQRSNIIWPPYLTYLWGVFNETDFAISTFENSSKSKTTPSQVNGNYFKASINWCFDEIKTPLLKTVASLVKEYLSSIDSDNDTDDDDTSCTVLNNNRLQQLVKFLEDNDDDVNKVPKEIKRLVNSFLYDIEQNKFVTALDKVRDLNSLLTKELRVKNILLNNMMLILGKVKNYIFDGQASKKDDDRLYKIHVVAFTWLLRYKLGFDVNKLEDTILTDADVEGILKIMKDDKLLDAASIKDYLTKNSFI